MKKRILSEEEFKKIKPWMILVLFGLIAAAIIWNLSAIAGAMGFVLSLFKSLLYGIMIAYVLNQPMKHIEAFIERHFKEKSLLRKGKRSLSMILTFILALIMVSVLGMIIVPSIVDSIVQLLNNMSSFLKDVVSNIDDILVYFNVGFKLEDLTQVEEFMKMPWKDILSQTVSFLGGSANGIMSNASAFVGTFGVWFTGFMFSLYLLSSKESFIRQLRKVIAAVFGYDNASVIFTYAARTNRIFSSFIGGQLVEAAILWILYYVTMRLFQFPYPELISTLIAVFSLVPVFGPMLAMALGAVLILSIDWTRSIWFIIYFQVVSQFEDNVIYPRVVGNSVGLPGLWVLCSIFVFGSLFGVFGMIMAVPTTACLYTLFAEIINTILRHRRLRVSDTDMEYIPIEEQEEKKVSE